MMLWLLTCLAGVNASAEGQLIDPFDYHTAAAARQVWRDHADRGTSQPVEVVEDEGRSVLELSVPFAAQPQLNRVYIDRDVQLNLAAVGEVGLELLSTVPEASGRISLYLRSGDGWYAGGKGLEAKGWQTLRFSKAAFTVEGHPVGWHQIDGIRIAVWRESSADFQVRFRALRAIQHDVALIIPSARAQSELRSALQTAEDVGEMLAELGLGSDAIEDEAIVNGALGDRRVAILAHNPDISDAAIDALLQFVAQGGKVLVCYQLPTKLGTALGFAEPTHVRPSRSGELAEVRFDAPDIAGLPASMRQASWNITRAKPAAFNARVIAQWYDDAGQATGQPALLLSDRGAFFSHIILRQDRDKKKQMLAAVLGHLAPSLWKDMADSALAASGRVGHLENYARLVEFLKASKQPGSRRRTWLRHERLRRSRARNRRRSSLRKSCNLLGPSMSSLCKPMCWPSRASLSRDAPVGTTREPAPTKATGIAPRKNSPRTDSTWCSPICCGVAWRTIRAMCCRGARRLRNTAIKSPSASRRRKSMDCKCMSGR